MPTDVRKRARMAVKIAEAHDYCIEYDTDQSPLPPMVFAGIDDIADEDMAGVERYMVISTEYAGDGPADNSAFFATKAEATKHMGEYARGGWTSRMWDLDADTTEPIKERAPR